MITSYLTIFRKTNDEKGGREEEGGTKRREKVTSMIGFPN
jgi:hypothetical protein